MERDELQRRFVYHPPNEETRLIHDTVRGLTLGYAAALDDILPGESREKALFFTALEEASFWAHADIARNRQ